MQYSVYTLSSVLSLFYAYDYMQEIENGTLDDNVLEVSVAIQKWHVVKKLKENVKWKKEMTCIQKTKRKHEIK